MSGCGADVTCLCTGLDTPVHIFGDNQESCPLAGNEPVFRQMLASLWFRHGVPLDALHDVTVPAPVRSAAGYRSGFVAAVKPAGDPVPLLLLQEAAAHERFQQRRDKVKS